MRGLRAGCGGSGGRDGADAARRGVALASQGSHTAPTGRFGAIARRTGDRDVARRPRRGSHEQRVPPGRVRARTPRSPRTRTRQPPTARPQRQPASSPRRQPGRPGSTAAAAGPQAQPRGYGQQGRPATARAVRPAGAASPTAQQYGQQYGAAVRGPRPGYGAAEDLAAGDRLAGDRHRRHLLQHAVRARHRRDRDRLHRPQADQRVAGRAQGRRHGAGRADPRRRRDPGRHRLLGRCSPPASSTATCPSAPAREPRPRGRLAPQGASQLPRRCCAAP